MPKEERNNTGKGMPYLVPGNALSVSGINTMIFAIKIVIRASVTLKPK